MLKVLKNVFFGSLQETGELVAVKKFKDGEGEWFIFRKAKKKQ